MTNGSKDKFKNVPSIETSQILKFLEEVEAQKIEHLNNKTKLFYEIKKILTSARDGTLWKVIVLWGNLQHICIELLLNSCTILRSL